MYNLCSCKQNTVSLPVEIQLTEEKQFIESILKHNTVLDIPENMSDSDTSGSDLNCSELLNDLDEVMNTDINSQNTAGNSHMTGSNSSLQRSDPDMQQAINARIPDQLQKIGQRLDKIENKDFKKTADKSKIKSSGGKVSKPKKISEKLQQSCSKSTDSKIGQFTSMADKILLQLKVDQRLQELLDLAKSGTISKLKSQRGGNVDVLVKNKVRWPHEHVLSGFE